MGLQKFLPLFLRIDHKFSLAAWNGSSRLIMQQDFCFIPFYLSTCIEGTEGHSTIERKEEEREEKRN